MFEALADSIDKGEVAYRCVFLCKGVRPPVCVVHDGPFAVLCRVVIDINKSLIA